MQRPAGGCKGSQAPGPASGRGRELPQLYFQRKASRCWEGVQVLALVEVRVEGSADDQPPHLTGPGPDLIQLGISQKAAHGKVIDVAVATCSQGVGREERTTGKVMGSGQNKRSKQKAKDTETGQRKRD